MGPGDQPEGSCGLQEASQTQRLRGMRPEAPPDFASSLPALGQFESDLVLALLGDRAPVRPRLADAGRTRLGGGAAPGTGSGRWSTVRAVWRAAPAASRGAESSLANAQASPVLAGRYHPAPRRLWPTLG